MNFRSYSKIGTDLALLVQNNVLVALLLTMVASLVLSMGMPTLPAYATVITIMGIFLTQLAGGDTPVLAVHLFVLYFGVLSPVTPPVALAAYAAAPIAGAHPFETGIAALRLCFVAFVIPYAFFFHPQLLIGQVEFDTALFALVAGKLSFAVFTLTAATTGYFARSLTRIERGLILALSVAVIAPTATIWGPATVGLLTILASIAFVHRRKGRVA